MSLKSALSGFGKSIGAAYNPKKQQAANAPTRSRPVSFRNAPIVKGLSFAFGKKKKTTGE